MNLKKKRCLLCHAWFLPEARVWNEQRVCQKVSCQKERKKATDRQWWQRHRDYGKTRRKKIHIWAKGYPDYWVQYRSSHPLYRARDNRRRRFSRRRAKNAAKQVAFAQFSVEQIASTLRNQQESLAQNDAYRAVIVEKLAHIPRHQPESAAKQVALDPRVDAVIDAFLLGQRAAKQADIASLPSFSP